MSGSLVVPVISTNVLKSDNTNIKVGHRMSRNLEEGSRPRLSKVWGIGKRASVPATGRDLSWAV